MAQTTTNYGLYKPEATDTYNHLVYDNPNMDAIDAAMKDNANHGVDNASCIKSGTVHSVTRTNTSCPVFKFTATGDWNTGDTMNVDGTPVSVFLPNGTAPLTGCFVINTEVMAIISGSRVTLLCPVIPDASGVSYDNTGTMFSGSDVETVLGEISTDITGINNKLEQKITGIAITNSRGGVETRTATLYYTGNVGVLSFTYACQNATSESVTFALPADWYIPYGAFALRDNTNGALILVWGSNAVETYGHSGTMVVGNVYAGSILVLKN